MHRLPFLLVIAILISSSLKAQIFINTGNPNLEKYKKEDPNAVIWDGGKNVPIPPNIPPDGKTETKKEVKKASTVTKHDVGDGRESPYSAKTTRRETQPLLTLPKSMSLKKTEEKQPSVSKPVKKEEDKPQVVTHKEAVPDYPPNAIPGHCYARCVIPDQFDFKEEQVLDKPASVNIERIAARFVVVYDTVIAVPEGKRTTIIPAQYETVMEDKLVTPATQKWVKVQSVKNCLSSNPKDCEVWSLKDFPAVYEKVPRKVEVVRESERVEIIPAITKVVPRKKIVEPAQEIKTDIPPTYKTVMRKTLLKKGGGYEWKEIICEQNVTEAKIASIQQALQREGYDPGTMDNQMGGKTKEALIKFQQDKGLPVGNLNVETLKALGVE
ncbi:MAG: peptidoglycan-binding domain 1 protein [Bacteroidota bacterium]|nr:peptidoglycan-binding domain 1 protein [Bacteroidota bacterium]